MARNEIRNEYFDWLYGKVMKSSQYTLLLSELDRYDYIYKLPMDANRYEHGTELRYRFARECHIPDNEISAAMDISPCTMLEMMAALALRIAEGILDDGSLDRTSLIFMAMLRSLGLDKCKNSSFDRNAIYYVRDKLDAFTSGDLYLFPTYGEPTEGTDLWFQAHRFIRKGAI